MKKARQPFTWHYYAMALGVLAAALAATLSAWSATAAAVGFAVISHPGLRFAGLTRQVILVLFALMYVFAFPVNPAPHQVETAPQPPLRSVPAETR